MNSRIERRVTVLCILVIFLVLTWIMKIFTLTAPNRRSDDIEEKKLRRIIMRRVTVSCKPGFLVGSNRLQRQFNRENSKM